MLKAICVCALVVISLVMAGCSSNPRNPDARGVVTKKQHDEGIVNVYPVPGKPAVVPVPDVYWLWVRGEDGKVRRLEMDTAKDIQEWHLVKEGERWPIE
jgi:hypothetical protein